MARRVWSVVVAVLPCAVLAVSGPALAQQNRIDAVTPMAPERAAYGSLPVGVRTLTATDRGRADVLNTTEGGSIARYDRTLTIEVWYPAVLAAGPAGGRRVPHRRARSLARRHPPRQGRARRGARGRGRRVSARHPLARVPRQPLPAQPSRREPGVEGIRRRVDRSPRQHLRRPEGVREHPVQPSLRPAVRAGRARSAVPPRLRQRAGRTHRRVAHGDRRVFDGRLRPAQRARRGVHGCARHRVGRAAQPAAVRARRVEPRLPEGGRPADQGGDRDRAVGMAGRHLGRQAG